MVINKNTVLTGEAEEDDDEFYDAGEEAPQNVLETPPRQPSPEPEPNRSPSTSSTTFTPSDTGARKPVSSGYNTDDITTEEENDRRAKLENRNSYQKRPVAKIEPSDPDEPCCSRSLFGQSGNRLTKRMEIMSSSEDSDIEVLTVRKTVHAICHNDPGDDDDDEKSPESTPVATRIDGDDEKPTESTAAATRNEPSRDREASPVTFVGDTPADSRGSEEKVAASPSPDADEAAPAGSDSDTESLRIEDTAAVEELKKIVRSVVAANLLDEAGERRPEEPVVRDDSAKSEDDGNRDENAKTANDVAESGAAENAETAESRADERNDDSTPERIDDPGDCVTAEVAESVGDAESAKVASESTAVAEPSAGDRKERSEIAAVAEKMDVSGENVLRKSESKENLVDDLEPKTDTALVAAKDKQILKELNCGPSKTEAKICPCRVLLNKVDFDEHVLRTHKVNASLFANGKVAAFEDDLSSVAESEQESCELTPRRKVRKTKSYFENRSKSKRIRDADSSESDQEVVIKSKRRRNNTDGSVSSGSPQKSPSKIVKRLKTEKSPSTGTTPASPESKESRTTSESKRTRAEESRTKTSLTPQSPASKRAKTETTPVSGRTKESSPSASSTSQSSVSPRRTRNSSPHTSATTHSPVSPRRARTNTSSPRSSAPAVPSPSPRRTRTKESSPRDSAPSASPVSERTRTNESSPRTPVSQRSRTNESTPRTPASRRSKTNESSPRLSTPSTPASKLKAPSASSSRGRSPPARTKKSSVRQINDSLLAKMFSLKTPVIALDRVECPSQNSESGKPSNVRRSLKFTAKRQRSESSEEDVKQEKFSSDENEGTRLKKKPKYAKNRESPVLKKNSDTSVEKTKNVGSKKAGTPSRVGNILNPVKRRLH